MRIVLKQEKKEHFLETPYLDDPTDDASDDDWSAYEKHTNDILDVSYLMLATKSSEL